MILDDIHVAADKASTKQIPSKSRKKKSYMNLCNGAQTEGSFAENVLLAFFFRKIKNK
jgi:hypothetical protein